MTLRRVPILHCEMWKKTFVQIEKNFLCLLFMPRPTRIEKLRIKQHFANFQPRRDKKAFLAFKKDLRTS
jgi:hypothetical protein